MGPSQPDFREDLYRARELRGDWAFGEEIIKIADDASNDWKTAANGREVVNKELVLRSKLRIEARQFHMSRLHPQQWGDRQQIDVKNDYSQMSEEERIRRALELVGIVKELAGPRPEPPKLRYDPGTEEAEPEPSGIGG